MSITLIIIVVTVVASLYAWNNPSLHDSLMMNPYRIRRNKEYYRFLTSGFIHSGYVHLGFNMLSLYFFGRYVELFLGPTSFLILYLSAIVVSDIPTFLREQKHPGYRSLGASGGVAAVIFSSILLHPMSEIYIYFIPIRGFIFGAIYLIYSYYQSKNSTDNIGHEAHFYGALFGVFYTIVIFPSTIFSFIEQISGWSMF